MNVWIAFVISLAMILGILGIVFVVVILNIFGCCKEKTGITVIGIQEKTFPEVLEA